MIRIKQWTFAAFATGSYAALAAAALAQEGANRISMPPDPPIREMAKPTPEGSNGQDKLFMRQAALSDRAEVELGNIAQKKSQTPSVRDFARHMVDAHSRSNQQLMQLSRRLDCDLPKELDADHQAVLGDLNKLSGKDFDLKYVSSQIAAHQRTANLLEWHISAGQNETLKKYSIDTLPEVMNHLEMAKEQYALLTPGAGRTR